MPTYVVTGPDGKKYRVTAPEGASDAEVMARVQGHSSAPADNSRSRGFLGGMLRPLDNAATWLANTPVGHALDRAGQAIGLDSTAGAVAKNDALRNNNKRTGYQLLGNIAGTLPTLALGGGAIAQGALGGALLSNKPNDLRSVARDAVIGGVSGKAGELAGKYVAAPIAERIGRTQTARRIGEGVVSAVNRIPRVQAKLPPTAPRISKPQRAVSRMTPEVADMRQNIADAADLGLPYSLADANPRLRQLGGSVARFSPDGRALAEKNYGARAMGQADRAIQGIDQHLAPITNIEQRGQEIRQTARAASQPYYDEALRQPAPFDYQLDEIINTPAGSAAAQRAYNIALNRGVSPGEIETLVSRAQRPPNMMGDTPASGVAPANVAADGKIYVGPAGGSHFGVSERFPDAKFTGETGFVNPEGKYLNREEALAYVNGTGNNIRPSENMTGQLDSLDYREQAKPVQRASPTFQSLDLIKKGLDGELKPFRNPITQKLQLEGDDEAQAVNDLLQRYKARLDELNPDYATARATYAEHIAPRTALETGYQRLANNALPQRQFDAAVAGMNEKSLPEAQRGFATALADQVNKQRYSRNPYESVYGSPLQQGKVAALFPEGAPKFNRQYGLENEMAATRNEVLGGSQTQPRAIADQMFQGGVGSDAVDMGIQALTGGGLPGAGKAAGALLRYAKDRSQLGLVGAKSKADALAPQLFDTSNPKALLDFVDEMSRKLAQERARKEAYRRGSGLLGGPVGIGLGAGFIAGN